MTDPFDVQKPGLQYYVERLKVGDPYTFIRYGDGEWSAIMQDRPRTSSRSQGLRIPALKKQMKKSIIKAPDVDNYIAATRPGSQRPGIGDWLRENKPDHLHFHDCRVFYQASKHGRLYPFIKALREHALPVIVVGPERLKALHERVFDITGFVTIPNKDCFVERDRIMLEVLSYTMPKIVLLTAGPAAKIMAFHLYHRIGAGSFIIDLGSLWDVYTGKASRSYQKIMLREPWRIRANLTGEGGK